MIQVYMSIALAIVITRGGVGEVEARFKVICGIFIETASSLTGHCKA